MGAMNAIWKRVNESISRHSLSVKGGSAVIRQRLFLLLCSEYLRIRSHPQRSRDVEIEQFLKCGSVVIDSLCRIKVVHFESFQETMKRRIHREYDQKIERLRADGVNSKNTKHRYQYVYNPPD